MNFHYNEKICCSESEYDTYNLAKLEVKAGKLFVYCREEVLPEIEELTNSWKAEFQEQLEINYSHLDGVLEKISLSFDDKIDVFGFSLERGLQID